ncbi:S49 family peptidase [Bradyrhizobium sp. 83012]|uniref:S49 family peptidase n=1 Tax=Bradyrhizobium aeschynomenes TaxID=2734909 RepID=A0ABX2C4Z7_9BRAD|nr:S49 family peptidase [Bradyrhizobium aeschynomenes]NPU63379.1 S49 family peptidase [Bradyrhizobium aeschynomenes]
MSLPRIASRVFDTPLMIAESKAIAFLAGFGGRLVDGGVVLPSGIAATDHVAFANGRPSAGVVGDSLGRYYQARGRGVLDMVGNVAVIPIEGTLVHKGAYVGSSSGETSYEGLRTQVAAARSSPNVAGVVYEVDSFGGEVAGAFETADMMAQLSKEKPTLAILTDFALSAGYLMASTARQVIMPELGRAGSIGVIRMHVDMSRKLENDGMRVTLITAGKRKADGNPVQPLPADVADAWRAEVEGMRQLFASRVGQHRGRRFSAEAALATEAADFGAADAVRLGLVDAIGPSQAAFEAFVTAINKR